MPVLSRRALITGVSAIGASWGLAGCGSSTQTRSTAIDPAFQRKEVDYPTQEARGTIIVDPPEHYLYLVQEGGRALRYGVGVGSEGFGWSGIANVRDKQQSPDWYPTAETLQRKPEIIQHLQQLQSGFGIPGGIPNNPMGACALYLWQGNKDTLYRIHGTNEPWTIGQNVSSGCIRLVNDDAIDLYDKTPIGTKVIVLPTIVA